MNNIVKISKNLRTKTLTSNLRLASRCFCNEIPVKDEPKVESKEGGYAKAFRKFETQLKEENEPKEDNVSFASLLRNSNFIDVNISFLIFIFV